MPALSDYLLKTGPGTIQPNLWVRLLNNITAVSYISDAVTDVNGKFTFSVNPPPPGTYSVFTGSTGTIGGTQAATGDTNYIVPGDGFELANTKVYNALSPKYTINGDGTDEHLAIQAFLNGIGGSLANAGIAFFPATANGYGTTVPLLPKSYTTVAGDGFGTLFNQLAANITLFSLNDIEGWAFDNFRTHGIGPWNVAGRGAIWAAQGVSYGARRGKMTRLWIDGAGTCGIVLADASDIQLDTIEITGTLEHGIYVSGGTSGVHDILGSNITIVAAGIGSSSSNVDGIKIAAAGPGTLTRVIFNPVQIRGTKDEGVLFEGGATDCLVGGGVDGSGQRNVRYNAGSTRCTFQGKSTNGTVESIRFLGGARNRFIGEVDAPNHSAVQIDVAATETDIDVRVTGTCGGVDWAIDDSGQDTFVAGIITNSVPNGWIARAASTRHTNCLVNRATSSPYSILSASTKVLAPNFIRQRDNGAMLDIANATGGTVGLLVDMGNGQYALGISGAGLNTTTLGALGTRQVTLDGTNIDLLTLVRVANAIMPGNPGGGTASRAQVFSGTGAPNNANGNNGDFYFRTDTPATVNQRVYNKQAGAWVGIL